MGTLKKQIHPPIPYSRQAIEPQDIEAVCRVLESDFITQGPAIDAFEHAVADYCGAKYAVAVSSGTAALHLAALAAGLKPGDEAITTPITFLATANCILYAGARPVFADIDAATVNLDPEHFERSITKRTRAVLPVDFAGLPASMEKIRHIADRHGLVVIEDASHALGGSYEEGRKGKVGSCRYSDMTIFSFHPVKHITTGEGGCVTTHNKKFYEKLKSLRSHGIDRNERLQKKKGGWYYEMEELGFNYRVTDFQCALGTSQLRKIDQLVAARAALAKNYDRAFAPLSDDLILPAQRIKDERHAWHLYLLRLRHSRGGRERRRLYDFLRQNGVHAQVHYIPIYRQPFYRQLLSGRKIHCPHAERYYEQALSLPLYPGLGKDQQDRVIDLVKVFFGSRPVRSRAGEFKRRSVLSVS